jgi:2-phosphoglycolate phosphatase
MTASSLLRAPLAVAFDLDGTLIDSKGDIAAACNRALVAVGRAPLDEAVIATFVGDGARVLLARALDREPDDALVDRALSAFQPFYDANAAVRTTLLPGALAVLDVLSTRPIALVTNKPRSGTLAVLKALGIDARFAFIRTGSDGPLKPHRRAITDALDAIGVAAADTWVVGDAEQDVRAGRAAGCPTIVVRGGFQSAARVEAARPDLIVDSLLDVAALITKLGQ